jgi:hypothetical protein
MKGFIQQFSRTFTLTSNSVLNIFKISICTIFFRFNSINIISQYSGKNRKNGIFCFNTDVTRIFSISSISPVICMFIYRFMYIHAFICICIYVCIYIFIYRFMYIHTFICIYIRNFSNSSISPVIYIFVCVG